MPELANGILGTKCHQLLGLNLRIEGLTKLIDQHAWLNANARRLMRRPGIGPITASAIVGTIGDAHHFKTGRDLAAWLGLTPLNKSSGGKERLRRITIRRALGRMVDDQDGGFGEMFLDILCDIREELDELNGRLAGYNQRIRNLFRSNEMCQRIGQIEGVGPITATALVAAVGDRSCFKNGRQFAA